jgi:hypothetical protein
VIKKFGFLGIIIAIIALAVVAIIIANQFASKQLNKGKMTNQQCQSQPQANHTITIQNDKASPGHISALQCDKLTIINKDEEVREIAFGPHDDHVPYDGITERVLGKDQSLTVTLVQVGNFRVHDHIHNEVQATFTVSPR